MMDSPLDAIIEQILEDVLEGRAVDIEAKLREHPELTEDDRRKIRARTSLFGGRTVPASAIPFERIGDFRVIKRLGEGAMGIVYLAEQMSLGREVALKLIRPEYVGSSDAEARFEREARAIAALRHPGIVAVHASGVESGIRYIAMDLVPGTGLDEVLRESVRTSAPIAISKIVTWAREIAEALQFAHRAGVIHRDVKPSNVRITPEGKALLLDFGLARLDTAPALRTSRSFLGSPAYASPEQVEGSAQSDARTDVYSLGATLYECVTHTLPFPGTTTEQVLHRILTGAPAPPRRINPAISRDLETVLLKALERDPARRYTTAAAFAADLSALLEMRPIQARPAGLFERTLKWCKRNRTASSALGAAAGGFLLMAGFYAQQIWSEASTFREHVRLAQSALSERRFDDALECTNRAVAMRPDDPNATLLRMDITKARDQAASLEFVKRAQAQLAKYRELLTHSRQVATEIEPLRRERNTRYLKPEQHLQIAEGERKIAAAARSIEQYFFEILELLNQAERLGAQEPAIAETRADIWMERWRDARRDGNNPLAAYYASIVKTNDQKSRYSSELLATGTASMTTVPDSAEVHLFRYRELSDLIPRAENRLVPVPVGDFTPPVPYGEWCLRVTRASPGFEVNDLIVKVAGRPIRGVILVVRTVGEIRAFDRLVSVDGKPIREAYDVSLLSAQVEKPHEMHSYEFERDEKTFIVKTPGIKALGIRAWEPDSIVFEVPSTVDVYRNGEVRRVESPGQLAVVTTGTPIFISDASRVPVPVDKHVLEQGSYLALVRKQGFEDQRVPFVVEAGRETAVNVVLNPTGTTPRGFVYIAGGVFQSGGDPQSFAGWSASQRDLPGFWIAEREANESEFAAFLNDPEFAGKTTLHRLLSEKGEAEGFDIIKKEDGTFGLRLAAGYPMQAVPWRDAVVFAEWRTQQFQEAGIDLICSLPTEEEWEKAARGVDGRAFVFGNRFDPTWVKSRFGHDDIGREYVLRFPLDESPYGVYDMTGSQWEWCADKWDSPRSRAVRGGSWTFIYEANFRAATRAELDENDRINPTGIRLVARKR